jgi:hypothetical protein
MIAKSTVLETARFDTSHPDLCAALRWKAQFILAEADPTVPPSNEGLFWCIHTQTCIGPDGKLAEPGNCSSSHRKCYGTGNADK